jgi:hypothetical protein
MDRKMQLIHVLMDCAASEDERDDAAMDLADFNDGDVIQTLFLVATDESCPSDMVKGSCGESLASIWIRTGKVDVTLLHQLDGSARQEAMG